MNEEIKNRLDAQDELLAKTYVSVEKIRKYFMWTFIVSIVVFVLPLLGLLIAVPNFLSTYTASFEGL